MDNSSLPNLDLGLSPDDPLSLLLHSSPSGGASSPESNISDEQSLSSDWASLWTSNTKPEDNQLDSQFMQLQQQMQLKNLENDLELSPFSGLGTVDFNTSMVVDPTTLHSNYGISPEAVPVSQDSFPFTFQAPQSSFPRRLSLGSASESSASAASYSPVVDSSPPSMINDSAAQLAQRVRQSAGITYASPTGAALQSHGLTIAFPEHPGSTPYLIHALGDESQPGSSISSSSSTASTPPPPTPPLGHAAAAPTPLDPSNAKPKTSHTTIERRYRTNLNTRIHALRMAVPALRVLEEKETSVGGPGKKGGKGKLSGRVGVIKPTSPSHTSSSDIVDERGFIDGVKVARKVSKANVLGKAVEYIRVLKKREARLQNEQEGLKELISGLVGGPALVKKWEEEWRAIFGGKEKDELEEGEGIEACADDGSEDEGDSDDERRKRKKAKVEPRPKGSIARDAKAPSDDGPPTEKRKRGRPRKNPLPSAPPSSGYPAHPVDAHLGLNANMLLNMAVDANPELMSNLVHPPPTYPQSQVPQYMMATFALFSFFNSPLTRTFVNDSEPHQGHVLATTHTAKFDWTTLTWHDLVQGFHLVVSILIFASIVLPWLPSGIYTLSARMPKALHRLRGLVSSKDHSGPTIHNDETDSVDSDSSTATITSLQGQLGLSASFLNEVRGTEEESTRLRQALGSSEDGFLRHIGRMGALFSGRYSQEPKVVGAYEQRSLTQRAWVRLGELIVLPHENNVATYSRVYTYYQIRSHVHWFGASTGDLVTMALLLWPVSFARGQAQALWDTARTRSQRAHEKLVLETLTPEEAWNKLEAAREDDILSLGKYTPIGLLGRLLVESRMKKHLKVLFVDASSATIVGGGEDKAVSWDLDLDIVKEREDMELTADAAMSLGGRHHRALGESLKLLSSTKDVAFHVENPDELLTSRPLSGLGEDTDSEILVLLISLMLLRSIFPSSIRRNDDALPSILVSPVPNKGLEMRLRILLGDDVFDAPLSDDGDDRADTLAVALDDARETIVGLLEERQEFERKLPAPVLLS